MLGSKPGSAVNSGSSESARLIFTVPLRVFQCVMSLHELVRQLGRVMSCSQEGDLRVTGRDDDRRDELLATLERDAVDAAVGLRDPARPGRSRGSRRRRTRGRVGARVADRAHAALGVAPARDLAVADVADRVVHQHVRGAGRIGTGPRSDDAVDRHEPLEHG